MAYPATVYRLLLSAPGDVPDGDVATVASAINRWNVIYGQQLNAAAVLNHWKGHSVAEHGARPQESLNRQLVDRADIVIALFWHRLGSPTGAAASGTVEEIDEAHAAGSYVAILRCTRPMPTNVDTDQLARLNEFYADRAHLSLMLQYADEAELSRHIDAILTTAVSRDSARAELTQQARRRGADVWPRVDHERVPEQDSKGRLRTKHHWELVLANRGDEPARDVKYGLEAENETERDVPRSLTDDEHGLEVLAPGGEARYILSRHMGTADQARCIVTWDDSAGTHENVATLRF